MEDIVVFLELNAFTSDNSYLFSNSKNTQFHFVEKPHRVFKVGIIAILVILDQTKLLGAYYDLCMETHIKLRAQSL